MLSEKELRYLIKKKLMLQEGLLGHSTAGQRAASSGGGGGGTGGGSTGGSTGGSGGGSTGGMTSIGGAGGRLPTGGASAPAFISNPADATSISLNDEDDLKALSRVLVLRREPIDASYRVQMEKAYQEKVVDAIMDRVTASEATKRGARAIFGQNIEEKINKFYTKQITTKDLFNGSDPTVQVALGTYSVGGVNAGDEQVRYNPLTTTNVTWSPTDPTNIANNFPFYWLKFIIDRDFQINPGSSVTFNATTGDPEFSTTSLSDFKKETTDLYTEELDKFDSQYSFYLENYYTLRGDVTQYFDDNEGLAYVHLLHDLLENDYDQENLPMTRMFFAKISAEAYTGYAGGEDYEEAMGMFAVGEDHRVRSWFASGNSVVDLEDNLGTVFPSGNEDGIVAAASNNYVIPYQHVATDGFGSLTSRAFGLSSRVKDSKDNLEKVIKGILERKMDGPNARANLQHQKFHEDAYKDEFNNETSPFKPELQPIQENNLKKLIKKYLITEKKKLVSVGLDAEFESMVDPRGYIFVHFGPSTPTISPRIYLDKTTPLVRKDVPPLVRASDLYRLCYYAYNWIDHSNTSMREPYKGTIFNALRSIYLAAELEPGGFDLNATAVLKVSDILRISKQLQAGTDPYGIKTSGGTTDPSLTPPTSAELTQYQNAIISADFCMEAMRVKEVANAMFNGIRKKEKGYKQFLNYLESNKKDIMLGKNMDRSYEAALEGGMKPELPAQEDDNKEAISKMYEYFASMKEFSSSEKQSLLSERDAAIAADGGRGAMELGSIKTDHPMFSKAIQILMQQKLKKDGKVSYDDILRLSDDFANSASVFNLSPDISGMYEMFLNLKKLPNVTSREMIKLSAASGNEIKFDEAFGSTSGTDKIISAPGSSIPGGTSFDVSASESAMSDFSKLLKDSDNTLNQELTITLFYRAGKIRRIKKIEDRLGGNIKVGLRRWVNKSLIPSITPPSAGSGDIVINFPPARYIGKGLNESDITKELIKIIREYSF